MYGYVWWWWWWWWLDDPAKADHVGRSAAASAERKKGRVIRLDRYMTSQKAFDGDMAMAWPGAARYGRRMKGRIQHVERCRLLHVHVDLVSVSLLRSIYFLCSNASRETSIVPHPFHWCTRKTPSTIHPNQTFATNTNVDSTRSALLINC